MCRYNRFRRSPYFHSYRRSDICYMNPHHRLEDDCSIKLFGRILASASDRDQCIPNSSCQRISEMPFLQNRAHGMYSTAEKNHLMFYYNEFLSNSIQFFTLLVTNTSLLLRSVPSAILARMAFPTSFSFPYKYAVSKCL